jgi:hypothetical protein
LRLAGIPVEIDDDDRGDPHAPRSGVFIRQVGCGTSAIELNSYETGYVVHIRIVPNLGWPFWISSYRLHLPWEDPSLWLLDDPAEFEPPRNVYWLDGRTSFARNDVLNHCADLERKGSRGHPLQGYLVWRGEGPIPESYVHGSSVPAFVGIVNQFEREYREPISLVVDRSRRVMPRIPRRHKSRNITGKPVTNASEAFSPECEITSSGMPEDSEKSEASASGFGKENVFSAS